MLGEGLETQFWRLDNGQMQWLTWTCPRLWSFATAYYPRAHDSRAIGDRRSI